MTDTILVNWYGCDCFCFLIFSAHKEHFMSKQAKQASINQQLIPVTNNTPMHFSVYRERRLNQRFGKPEQTPERVPCCQTNFMFMSFVER